MPINFTDHVGPMIGLEKKKRNVMRTHGIGRGARAG